MNNTRHNTLGRRGALRLLGGAALSAAALLGASCASSASFPQEPGPSSPPAPTPGPTPTPAPTPNPRRTVLVWSEGTAPKDVYPNDINGAVAEALKDLPGGYEVKTVALSDPEQGVTQAALDSAAVLFWWGHNKHGDVSQETVDRVVKAIKEGGMGFVALHSAHFAKPFQAVLGQSGAWKEYVEDGKPHHVTVTDPQHPLVRGVRAFTIPAEERYEEPFVVPEPEAAPLSARHESTGTDARQLLCWTQGKGRVVYLRPGHETYPVYFQAEVRRILRNCALFAARDEAGIWEDADPSARAARAAGEPPLAVLLRDLGFGGTDVTAGGEVRFDGRFVRARNGVVTFEPLAAFGTLQTTRGGWYPAVTGGQTAPEREELWRIDGPNNKQLRPPLAAQSRVVLDPGPSPFGLWVASDGFPGEFVYTEDKRQNAVRRFGRNLHKAHVYQAVDNAGVPVRDTYLIGFEYSTNDDNQEIVAVVRNAKPAGR